MPVHGSDNRRVINPNLTEFTTFPLPAVTAIDTRIGILPNKKKDITVKASSSL